MTRHVTSTADAIVVRGARILSAIFDSAREGNTFHIMLVRVFTPLFSLPAGRTDGQIDEGSDIGPSRSVAVAAVLSDDVGAAR